MNELIEIKNIFREIEAIKAALADAIAELDKPSIYKDSHTAQLKQEARDKASEKLLELRDKAEAIIDSIKERDYEAPFLYDDPKLAAAVSFISTAGKSFPTDAARQMVKDFAGRPKELSYLYKLLDDSGHLEAAVEIASAVDKVKLKASLPQRLGDYMFYSLSRDPEESVDFSGFEVEIDEMSKGVS